MLFIYIAGQYLDHNYFWCRIFFRSLLGVWTQARIWAWPL